jgi:hypothetical protein
MSFAAVSLAVAFVLASAGLANAQRRNDREVRDAMRGLSSKIEDFDYGLTDQLRSSSADRDTVSQADDQVRALRASVRDFQTNFNQKRESQNDVNRIIEAARNIDQFLVTEPQNRMVMDDWAGVRDQIDRLAANYGITANWDQVDNAPNVADERDPIQKGTVTVGLSGTYSLDINKSENLDDAIGNINITSDQRDELKGRLEPPAQIAIDIRGNRVTLATSEASPVSIIADGTEKTEPDGKGASLRLRASLNGSSLTVSSLGGGETDYTVTFTSVDGGRTLKVSRRITTDYLRETVFAESVYNKTDNVAGLGIEPSGGSNDTDQNGGYSDNDQGNAPTNGGYPSSRDNQPNGGSRQTGGNQGGWGNQPNGNTRQTGSRPTVTNRTGDFVVPNGEIITGTLETTIDTKASQNDDRFRMTVQSPNEFRGATIVGYISGVNRSGRATGRSNVTFNFEKITLVNGRTYDFAGNLQAITDQNGKVVKVDSEGSAKGGNQTTQTAKRGGIGAGIGAIIGAIAGGGTGAAIGAAIGAGAGAGSVILQGRDDLQLMKGSTITVQSSSPIRQSAPPTPDN